MRTLIGLLLLLSLPGPALARDNTPALEAARTWAGTPYRWGGRGTDAHPGMDCLGILFRAYGVMDGVPWWAYAVNPSELVASGRLGAPVPGLDGKPWSPEQVAQLEVGDVLYFLVEGYEIPDVPLVEDASGRWWPWHTGLYAGEGQVLHAAPGGTVRTQPLSEVFFERLYVTRPE